MAPSRSMVTGARSKRLSYCGIFVQALISAFGDRAYRHSAEQITRAPLGSRRFGARRGPTGVQTVRGSIPPRGARALGVHQVKVANCCLLNTDKIPNASSSRCSFIYESSRTHGVQHETTAQHRAKPARLREGYVQIELPTIKLRYGTHLRFVTSFTHQLPPGRTEFGTKLAKLCAIVLSRGYHLNRACASAKLFILQPESRIRRTERVRNR